MSLDRTPGIERRLQNAPAVELRYYPVDLVREPADGASIEDQLREIRAALNGLHYRLCAVQDGDIFNVTAFRGHVRSEIDAYRKEKAQAVRDEMAALSRSLRSASGSDPSASSSEADPDQSRPITPAEGPRHG